MIYALNVELNTICHFLALLGALLDLINWTTLVEQYRSLSSSLFSFLHSPVTSSLLGPNILLNTLLSNTLSLRSSLNVSDHVQHSDKTTCENIVLQTLIIISLNSKLKDERFCTEWQQAFPEFNLLIIFSWIDFWSVNYLKPTCHVMHHQFNIQQLYALPTLYLCVLYLSENKQGLVSLTA